MDEQLTFEFEQRPTIKGFPELRWTGKRPYRSTQYYPAQLRESYGEEQNGWINKIFWGDNLQVMSHLLKEYRGKIDLIYIDPPFDSKADYKRKIEVKNVGKTKELENSQTGMGSADDTKYTGFEVYNVNNYDFFRNPVEARDLLIAALEIQPFPQSDIWDGELDGRMVKIMPVNRIATKADLKELLANLPYKTYEKRKEENPNQPVERITIVCMGHEPDLKGAMEQELTDYKVDIQIMDILRDKADLQLKRDSEAEIVREGGKLVIRAFYPMNLMQKLSLQKEYVEDWRQMVDSVMIDWNYDGVVMQPAVTDVPGKSELVKGIYDIPEGSGTIKVKITDLLSESLELEVR